MPRSWTELHEVPYGAHPSHPTANPGRPLKELLSQWLWMAKYVRRYWLHIGGYTLLNMTGSLLGLGTSMVSRTLVDSVTGHNSGLLGIAAAAYVGVGVGQIFISAIRSRLSLKINLHISNGVRLDIFHQIIETDWNPFPSFPRATCSTG